jgi:protein-S-isoprenylcysteine O-methyltransferase Ste14
VSEAGYNRALGTVRLCATFAFVAALVLLARPRPLEVALGFVIAAAGEAIRFWAAGHLLKTKELVTSGPYRFTRNPLYLGRLLILTGLCIMCRLPYYANWILLLAGYAVFFGYYMPRKERVEPARLRAVHGEAYERYFRAVPALLPSLRPYPSASNLGWSSDRMLRNREVWMVLGILAISVFLLYRSHRVPPRAEMAPLGTPAATAPPVNGS